MDAMNATFIKSLEYLEKKILKYFELMNAVQQEVFQSVKSSKDFKYYRLENMEWFIKVSHLLATKWADSSLKDTYQKSIDFYLLRLYPVCSPLSLKMKVKVANYGKILTAFAFLNGDYYLGLTCAATVLELTPLDAYVFMIVSKWSCKLREFDIFQKLDQNLPPETQPEVEGMRKLCRLYAEFFKSTETSKQFEIVEKVVAIKDELINAKDKTFFGYLILMLVHNLLGHASKLPEMDVEKHRDMASHFFNEQNCALSVLVNRIPFFKSYEQPFFLYLHTEIPDGNIFLKSMMAVPDFFDTSIEYAKVLLQTGCVYDCEAKLLYVLYYGLIVGSPFRAIQPLNMLYYLKFRTLNDKDKLKGFGAMIALLLGKMSDLKGNTTDLCRYRKDLLEDAYVFAAKTDSESVLNKTLINYVTAIPEHVPQCECFLCFENVTNGSMFAEKQFSELLIDGLSVASCNEFYSKMTASCSKRYNNRKSKLYEVVLKEQSQESNNKKAALLHLLTYICEISSYCLIMNPKIGGISLTKLCDNIIKCSYFYNLDLRYYYLLGRQFKRIPFSLDSYFWLDDKKSSDIDSVLEDFEAFGISNTMQTDKKNGRKNAQKSPTRETLASRTNAYRTQGKNGIGIGAISETQVSDLHEARSDFKLFQHLFFTEWRRRICYYLGSYLAEEYPWYSAWYFMEAQGISLRQHVRSRKTSEVEDMRFKDIHEFKNAVRALPHDFTLIQLVTDDQNILWFIRYSHDLIAIVLPLTKIAVGKDDVSHRMYELLVENDKSVAGIKDKNIFWKTRMALDKKLEALIKDVEIRWMKQFKSLLIPFGPFDSKILKVIKSLEVILRDTGFSIDRAKFLARLFLHADENDYKYLLSIFSFIERETFNKGINSKQQNEIYQKMLTCSSKNLIQAYLNQERYTVLIVSPELSCYPWECLPVFKSNPYILRTQSFHFFYRQTQKASTPLPLNLKSKESYYVLNPGGDLKLTEQRISSSLSLDKLRGDTGKCPSVEQFIKVLESNDVFLYIGHGNGNRYFGGTNVRKTKCKAVTILMGCSSVRIEDEGKGFDGKSAVNDYAIAGAPSTIGCLWMVTDGEIDKLLIDFVERCFAEWSKYGESKYGIEAKNGKKVQYPYRLLIKALVHARQACRLKTLTGGAVVAYGIPVKNHESNLQGYEKCKLLDK